MELLLSFSYLLFVLECNIRNLFSSFSVLFVGKSLYNEKTAINII